MSLIKRLGREPASRVEIRVSCNKLLSKDLLSKSDPCCVLYSATPSGEWIEVGRTEMIKNCLDPQFIRTFEVEYYFEEVQKYKFAVYDIDNKSPKLTDDDFLGYMECTLGEIVSNNPLTRPLVLKATSKPGHSTITLRTQEIGKQQETLTLHFCATKLDNKDFLSKSDPYLEFSRMMPDGTYQAVYRTEVVKNDLNPKWRPIEIKASRLCAGNYKNVLKVDCYDYDSNGSHDLIGSFETSVEELLQGATNQIQWPCINPKKKAKKKNYVNSGTVTLTSCKVSKDHSFLDFIHGGLQLNFTVAIDFTASNGNPASSQSLHYMNQYQPNHYMRAIEAVGHVIQDYDVDQTFPALGYGAKIPPNMEVSHAFPLTFSSTNPFCHGIKGILEEYRTCLSRLELYGPTNFAPIIHHVAQFASHAQRESIAKDYFILLILTDGVISDMAETLRAIVYASALPFSVVIVGVGSADFKAMDALDSEAGLLKDDKGNVAKRDIVQFVPFRDFEDGPSDALAKQILGEIPQQVCQYYRMNNITPSHAHLGSSSSPGVSLDAGMGPGAPTLYQPRPVAAVM